MVPAEQRSLTRYIQTRDAEAFRELVVLHQDMVYATCRRIVGNRADAEDAAQNCFLALARQPERAQDSLGGWLHRVAVRCAVDLVRGETARKAREVNAMTQPSTPASSPSWPEVAGAVDQALDALPDEWRIPLVRYYLEGRTQREIAAELGLWQAAVSKRLQRGAEELRERLTRAGVTLSVAALVSLLGANAAEAAPVTLTAALGKMALAGGAGSGAAASTATLGGGTTLMKMAIIVAVLAAVIAGIGVAAHRTDDGAPPSPAVSAPTPAASVERTEDTIALLERVSAQIKANYERIETWSGVVDMTYDKTLNADVSRDNPRWVESAGGTDKIGSTLQKARYRVEFAADFRKKLCYSSMRPIVPQEAINLPTGQSLGAQGAEQKTAVLRPDSFTHVDFAPKPGLKRIASREPAQRGKAEFLMTVVDVERVFDAVGGKPWKSIDGVVRRLKTGKALEVQGKTTRVDLQGDRLFVTAPYTPREGTVAVIERTYDLGAGGNCILSRLISSDGRVMVSDEATFEEKNGVYVPVRWRKVFGDDNLRCDVTFTFTDSVVNKPLDAAMFTWRALGLEDGDYIKDTLSGIQYVVTNGQLVDPTGRIYEEKPVTADSSVGIGSTPAPSSPSPTLARPMPTLPERSSASAAPTSKDGEPHQSTGHERHVATWLLLAGVVVAGMGGFAMLRWGRRRAS